MSVDKAALLNVTFEAVIWRDSRSEEGWTERNALKPAVAHIVTIGIVVSETSTAICIASTHAPQQDQFSSIMHIPKECIEERFQLFGTCGCGKLGTTLRIYTSASDGDRKYDRFHCDKCWNELTGDHQAAVAEEKTDE